LFEEVKNPAAAGFFVHGCTYAAQHMDVRERVAGTLTYGLIVSLTRQLLAITSALLKI
jgi:hypothetical protein